ncbi:MAG: hypothetical protein K1X88_36115 [Nannocystaceae bacterium]|nr:hypothetical protein [Nannocystaceae bacterium]
MTPLRALVPGLVALTLCSGACDRKRAEQIARTLVPDRPPRTAPKQPGLLVAGDPNPVPTAAALLGEARLVGIGGGIDASLLDDAMPQAHAGWIGPSLTRDDSPAVARDVLAIRHAAFGRRVVAADEHGAVDDRTLQEHGVVAGALLVAVIGPERSCIAGRGGGLVHTVDIGGNTLDVRWQLDGCGDGPFAPVGLVTDRMPVGLRFEPATCEPPDDVLASWQAAGAGADTVPLGAVRQYDALVGLVGVDDRGGALWLLGDDGSWLRRGFAIGSAQPRLLACGGGEAVAPSDADASAASEDADAFAAPED